MGFMVLNLMRMPFNGIKTNGIEGTFKMKERGLGRHSLEVLDGTKEEYKIFNFFSIPPNVSLKPFYLENQDMFIPLLITFRLT